MINLEKSWDNDLWVDAFHAVGRKLHQDAYEGVEAIREHYERVGSSDGESLVRLELPQIPLPPAPKYPLVPQIEEQPEKPKGDIQIELLE